MEKQETIDFSKFCGREEDGDSKAICTLQVASVVAETGEIKEIDAVSVLDSEIAIDIGHDIVTIDVKFENCMDFEYLQAGELCLRYKEKHSNQEYDPNETLLLTITESGEYADFLIGQDAMWAFTSEKPEDRNHMIRFWFLKDNFIIYRLSDQEIERVVEQVGEGLSQRKDGLYSARFTTCSKKRREKYFKSLKEATIWLAKEREKDGYMNLTNMTLDDWYKVWISTFKEGIVRDNTVKNYLIAESIPKVLFIKPEFPYMLFLRVHDRGSISNFERTICRTEKDDASKFKLDR